VNDLDQRLAELGRELEFPRTPDLAASVRRLIATQPVGPRFPARRAVGRARSRRLLLALGLLLVLAGTALAVPPVRHAIERVFDLQGASVVRGVVPPAPGARALGLGRSIPVSRVRTAASFRALLPARTPDAAYAASDVSGGRVTLVVGRFLVMEFRGQANPFMEKVIGQATHVTRVSVNGGPGVYLSGAPHELFFQDAAGNVRTDAVRLAGNLLLWQQGPVIVRIEGAPTLAAALELARSLR
jgi:hypothetical protein